jgi:hypothetical protein
MQDQQLEGRLTEGRTIIMPPWTFETLAQADRKTLEEVLVAATAPDPAQLAGYVYDGYNHDGLAQLVAQKFRKAFYQKEHLLHGFNQMVMQDGQRYTGEWRVRMKQGKPAVQGFYRVTFAKDEPPQKHSAPYRHLAYFNYDIDLNPRWNVPMRSIGDYFGLPNAGDHSLMLGKAYLRIAPGLTLFASYFVLGHPQTLDGAASEKLL